MSIHVSKLVWNCSRQQKSGALVVLLALADYARDDGTAWPAARTLARKARMSKRNVQRWLKALQRDGELKVFRNEGSHGSNLYKICLPVHDKDTRVAHGTSDTSAARGVTPTSSNNDASVTQFINESSIESSPVVPKGDDKDFWVKVCFKCFAQAVHPVRAHVLRELTEATPALNKKYAESLIEFYRTESLDSKEHPYSSRRHSPERLMLDLPRQLSLAVQMCPPAEPPKKPEFTIQEVRDYLTEVYPGCNLPGSIEELDGPVWEYIRPEIYKGMRERKQKSTETSSG